VVAVIQWRQEIARYTAPGSVKVLLYHGAKRGSITAQELQEADVVLTTYSTLENDYRRCIMPAKVACRWGWAVPVVGGVLKNAGGGSAGRGGCT
jgi:DNA repair protein RAD16